MPSLLTRATKMLISREYKQKTRNPQSQRNQGRVAFPLTRHDTLPEEHTP